MKISDLSNEAQNRLGYAIFSYIYEMINKSDGADLTLIEEMVNYYSDVYMVSSAHLRTKLE